MQNKIFLLLILLILIVTGCSKTEHEPPLVPADRAVLIYMAADNNLSSQSYKNIESIKKGALDNLKGSRLLIYYDQQERNTKPELIEIYQEGNQIKSRVRKEYSEHNSASIEVLSEVIKDAFRGDQSKSKGLILWSHGTAWLPVDQRSWTRAFGQDGNDEMEIYELKKALPDSFFDFIIFDACFMGSVEVCYELKDKAKYILSSPTEIFAEGLPYQLIVRDLFSGSSLEKSLTSICETYFSYYQGKSGVYKHVSISLVKTEELPKLMSLCGQITRHTTNFFDVDIEGVQPMMYANSRTKILHDFRDFYSRIATTDELTSLDKLLNNIMVYKNSADYIYTNQITGGTSFPMKKYSGLSTYVPRRTTPMLNQWYYENIDWSDIYPPVLFE